jgi:hypothetical protein
VALSRHVRGLHEPSIPVAWLHQTTTTATNKTQITKFFDQIVLSSIYSKSNRQLQRNPSTLPRSPHPQLQFPLFASRLTGMEHAGKLVVQDRALESARSIDSLEARRNRRVVRVAFGNAGGGNGGGGGRGGSRRTSTLNGTTTSTSLSKRQKGRMLLGARSWTAAGDVDAR